MIFDFSASKLPDLQWAIQNPKDSVISYLSERGLDSGSDRLKLARGEGRSGGDCLLVESPDEKSGLPGFWIVRGKSTGRRSVSNCRDRSGYLVPIGQRANRFSFDVRFDSGFRAMSSRNRISNLVIGTYHFDPNKINNRLDVKESDNWHFYHMVLLRHDLAQGDWIRVVLNETPQHQRSLSTYRVPANPTQCSAYWEIATRLYIDCTPYHDAPEIPRPVRMFVDNLSFSYMPPNKIDIVLPPEVEVSHHRYTEVSVTIINREGHDIEGTIAHRSRYHFDPKLLNEAGVNVHETTVKIAAGASREFRLCLKARDSLPIGAKLLHGIVFVPISEQRPNNASIADSRVTLNSKAFGFSGSCDSNLNFGNTNAKVIA